MERSSLLTERIASLNPGADDEFIRHMFTTIFIHDLLGRKGCGASDRCCCGGSLHSSASATEKNMKSLRGILRLLALTGLGAAMLVACVSYLGSRHSEQQGQRAFVAKDLTADILPPPLYLIEMRLVISQAIEGSMPLDQAKTEHTRLRNEYEDRIAYWKANPPYGLEAQLLGTQATQGQRFIEASAHVLEALDRGERQIAQASLAQAQAIYVEHRKGVDETVRASTNFAAQAVRGYEGALRQAITLQAMALVAAVRAI
jgi:hypothetical protein